MSHRNARLTPTGRLLLCRRIEAGSPIAHVAAQMGISRQCASKWWNRWREFGPVGLEDRPSAPIRRARIAARVEDRIVYLRRSRRWGPDRIAAYMGQSPSTVHRVLVRRGMTASTAWTVPPGGRSAATSIPIPARWSTWT